MSTERPHLSWVTYGLPVPQGSKRIVGAQRYGVASARLLDVNSHALKAWRSKVAEDAQEAMALAQWVMLEEVPIQLSAAFTLPAPLDIQREIKRDPLIPRPVHKTPDLDKLIRSICDAVTAAGVWKDDRHVARLTASKSYSRSYAAMEEPGVIITVREWVP